MLRLQVVALFRLQKALPRLKDYHFKEKTKISRSAKNTRLDTARTRPTVKEVTLRNVQTLQILDCTSLTREAVSQAHAHMDIILGSAITAWCSNHAPKKAANCIIFPEQMARPSKYQRTTSHIRVTRTPAGTKKGSAEKIQATSLIGFQGIKDFNNPLSIQTGLQFTQDINNHHLHLKNQDRFLF